jgi:hypothetical protein
MDKNDSDKPKRPKLRAVFEKIDDETLAALNRIGGDRVRYADFILWLSVDDEGVKK